MVLPHVLAGILFRDVMLKEAWVRPLDLRDQFLISVLVRIAPEKLIRWRPAVKSP
jgi:hypothetical protein